MTNLGKLGKTIGEAFADFVEKFLGWAIDRSSLTPALFNGWLLQHGFRRNEGTAARPRNVVDFAGFVRWIRGSMFSLLAWAVCFELYTLVLGTFNNTPLSLGTALFFGVLLFGLSWLVWLHQTIGRINLGFALLLAAFSIVAGAMFIGMPTYQYFHPHALPLIPQNEVQNFLGAGIPRLWSILGFMFVSAIVVPVLWTVSLGPSLLSLIFSKTPQEIRKIISEIIAALRGNTESQAQVQEYARVPTGMLFAVSAMLALFTLSLQLSPTVWGPYGALLIAMTSIVVLWIRKSNEFIGNFLTKALYGVATGGLIFICFLYGLGLAVLMLMSCYQVSLGLFALVLVCLLIALGSAVMTMFDATTRAEQYELAQGRTRIHTYTRRVAGFRADGSAEYEVLHPAPRKFPTSWMQSPKLWAALAVAGFLVWTLVLGHANPFSGIALNMKTLMLAGLALIVIGLLFGKESPQSSAPRTPAPQPQQGDAHHGSH